MITTSIFQWLLYLHSDCIILLDRPSVTFIVIIYIYDCELIINMKKNMRNMDFSPENIQHKIKFIKK